MWCDFDQAEINYELGEAARLGSSLIRTFLPFSLVMNYSSECSHVSAPQILQKYTYLLLIFSFDNFLGVVNQNGMKAIVGLFDEEEFLLYCVNNVTASTDYSKTSSDRPNSSFKNIKL
jgi:hypothetical protein